MHFSVEIDNLNIMRKILIFSLGAIFSVFACQSSSFNSPEKSVQEITSDSKISNASIIRNPASAEQPKDTVNVAKIEFEETTFDFGEVEEGEEVTDVYQFANTGKEPLLISNARSTCGCTVPDWPRNPIPPGGTGEIEVRFDTKNKKAKQTKPITITANTYPATTKVFLKGFVKAKEDGSEENATQ